jgi:flagellin-like hook-associated protein FlgL
MTSVPPLLSTIGWTRGITDSRNQMYDLQRQLGTGRVAETHGGLGTGRSLALSMQLQIARIDTSENNIDTLSLRLDVMAMSIDRFSEIVDTAKSDARSGTYVFSKSGKTLPQDLAHNQLDEALSLLNAEVAGRHVFSGRTVDRKPVESTDVILHGDGVRDGLDTIVAERKLADSGADGRGRLGLTNGGTSLTIGEDGSHPFGFKLAGISTSIAGATATQPTGTQPQSASIALAGQASLGDTLQIALDLPDGSRETITLTASADGSEPGTFAIGADETATLANIEAALGSELERVGGTQLAAASAITASRNFFSADLNNPPQRVDGPPFESATGLVSGTAGNTVIWYRGENDSANARETSVARIDDNIVVGYGARANEEPFAWGLAHMAALAVESFDANNANDEGRFNALRLKSANGLAYKDGSARTVQSLRAEFVGLQSAYASAQERHIATRQIAEDALTGVTQTNQEEIAVKLLQLQTQLQVSYEATAIISRLNLAQYL